MAIISETSDDAGDRNKKRKEEEEVENLPITQQIPDELIETIVALVRRCHYPKLSLISRAFHRLITSPELYQTRSRRRLTESVLYTLIGFSPFGPRSLYILHRSKISLRLSRINTLPLILPGSVVVTIGYNLYVIGGSVGLFQPVSTVILIDCRFHTWHYLPEMKRARCRAAAGVIDGKIYVIGGCEKRCEDWVEVFDVEKQIWETVLSPLIPNVASSSGEFSTYVVMDEKIYVLDRLCCLAYEPRRCQWETWGLESQLRRFWFTSSCVVDDMLYAIDPLLDLGAPIVVYDPMVMVWRPVKGLERWPKLVYVESKMVNFDEKLVVLGCNQSRYSGDSYWGKDLWCVEIVLEKRQGGEIWGEVGVISRVFTHRVSPFIELSRSVMV